MEHMRDPYKVFKDLLGTAFAQILKHLHPRKQAVVHDLCTKAAAQVKVDQSLNANKYFPIFQQVLALHHAAMTQLTLYYLQKLVSHQFLNGNCEDYCGPAPRQLIDSVVAAVCGCRTSPDERVQLELIKSVLTIVTSPQ